MLMLLLNRVGLAIPVALGVITLSFLLIHFVPGDPVDIMLGEQASIVEKTAMRESLGLHQPLLKQYRNFLLGVLRLDLGTSLQSRRSVMDQIMERVPATIELSVAALFIALLMGIPMGMLSAIYHNHWIDHFSRIGGLLGMSMPGFWLGPMLIMIFAIHLDWFPVSERGGVDHLVLPALSLAFALAAILMRMTRASVLEVLREDFVTVAHAKGLRRMVIYFKHVLVNALMPIVTIVGLQLGALLTGTVITETIFDWPGIGTLLFQAIQQRDYPLVQGCVLIISLIYVGVNLLTDLTYGFINPRLRVEA